MSWLVTLGAILVGTGLWLWILRRYDRIEPEEVRHLVLVGLLGGAASVVVAATLNEFAGSLLQIEADVIEDSLAVGIVPLLMFCLFVGLIEEVCKSTATVFTTRRFGDLNEPIDAMIYAMTVGLGFAAFENILYAARFGNEVLLIRFLWPVPAHMAYAALWGYGLAHARFIYPDQPRWRVMAPSVLVAGLVHALANFLLFLQATTTAFLSLVALAVLAYLAHLRLKQLVAESPFLAPGECPACRTRNAPHAMVCIRCEGPLQDTEMFVTCVCGQARVAVHGGTCPACGRTRAASGKPGIDDPARAAPAVLPSSVDTPPDPLLPGHPAQP